ncbi:hypothetical protein BCR44DRAFT_49241 [Catenaria anguillulae PL171]|uniref:PARP-type domain-containing protein n=1 Tax=Catenaria anguillulae PL171 TaxID=765915 RepID=A0A1Y2I0A6_9FUNG|nr:hypothetical protein BCR44DRAFT_49241 [Catenaria anguillulae PL171]
MSETQYYVEYSKSARAKCSYGKQCNEKIDKGELRLAVHFEAGDVPMTKYRHWRCITRTIINHINQATGGDLTGMDTLNADDQDLVRETLERGYYAGGTEDINLAAKAAGKAAKDAEKAAAKEAAKEAKLAAKAAAKAEKDAERERIKAEKEATKQAKTSARSNKSKASAAAGSSDDAEQDEHVSPAASPVKRNRRGAAIKRKVVAPESEGDEDAALSSEEDHEDVYSDDGAHTDASSDEDHHDDESEDEDEKPSSKRRKTASAKPAATGTRQSKRVAAARK